MLEAGAHLMKQSSHGVDHVEAEAESEDEGALNAPSTPPFDFPGEGVAVQLRLLTVSIHPRTGFRRLHQVGNCPLVPGADNAPGAGRERLRCSLLALLWGLCLR